MGILIWLHRAMSLIYTLPFLGVAVKLYSLGPFGRYRPIELPLLGQAVFDIHELLGSQPRWVVVPVGNHLHLGNRQPPWVVRPP